MRLLNIFAALSGALALIMLVIASHALPNIAAAAADIAAAQERLQLGGFIQLLSAAAALALTNRIGALNLAAGAMILAGAALFAGTLYTIALTGSRALVMLAPIGGITLILGWVVLTFTTPRAS